MGDAQSNYLLTTAENELGVVVAHSEAGKNNFILHRLICIALANVFQATTF